MLFGFLEEDSIDNMPMYFIIRIMGNENELDASPAPVAEVPKRAEVDKLLQTLMQAISVALRGAASEHGQEGVLAVLERIRLALMFAVTFIENSNPLFAAASPQLLAFFRRHASEVALLKFTPHQILLMNAILLYQDNGNSADCTLPNLAQAMSLALRSPYTTTATSLLLSRLGNELIRIKIVIKPTKTRGGTCYRMTPGVRPSASRVEPSSKLLSFLETRSERLVLPDFRNGHIVLLNAFFRAGISDRKCATADLATCVGDALAWKESDRISSLRVLVSRVNKLLRPLQLKIKGSRKTGGCYSLEDL